MRPVSAADAISPAFTRTRELLLQPFRPGRFFKIMIVAALAEVGCISAAVQTPLQVVMMFGQAMGKGQLPRNAQPIMLIVPLILLLVFSTIWLVLGYIFTRLRFVIFDFIVRRETSVGAAWRAHGRDSWRYFGLNLLVLLALMILVLSFAAPFLVGLLHSLESRDPARIMPHLLAIFAAAIAISLLVQLADSILRDFFLPQMALEDAAIEHSAGGFFRLFQESPGEVILYLLLKFALTIAFGMALALIVILCAGIIALALLAVGFVLFHFLWTVGIAGRTVVISYGILAGLGFVILYVAGLLAASGINGVFRTAYAAYFFGSRYFPLGSELDPQSSAISTPVVAETPLPPPFPEPPPVW